MLLWIDIGIDIHSINVGGIPIPLGYFLIFMFIMMLVWIIWLLVKHLFIPFMKKKWDSVEKVGELLPSIATVISNQEANRKAFDTLNHSVRTDLVHEMKDMKNSISGIMVMVKETQEDNQELAIAHSKLRAEHDVHVVNTDKSINEIRLSVHQILQLMPKSKE